ncbi:MAG: PmoA family protein, partial [Verrucomicrobiales bacterium]|nr:PmoA family protein [Verrucomicrobiales bacterium]
YWMFDLVSAQQCASSSPLTLLKYYYGGLGVRGNWVWNGTNNTFFLTSEGETNRVKGNTTRARWCHMSGLVDGAPAGLAILCHPDNFRAPQPMRLHPSEPFFCYAPSQIPAEPSDPNNKLSFQIKPGETYVSRFRFIAHDGPPDRAQLDRLWTDYAHPPQVKVE